MSTSDDSTPGHDDHGHGHDDHAHGHGSRFTQHHYDHAQHPFAPAKPGVHSAILTLDHAGAPGVEFRTQATVVAPTATLGDWLATTLCLMGPEAGLAFAVRTHPGVQARIVQRQADGQLKSARTPRF